MAKLLARLHLQVSSISSHSDRRTNPSNFTVNPVTAAWKQFASAESSVNAHADTVLVL